MADENKGAKETDPLTAQHWEQYCEDMESLMDSMQGIYEALENAEGLTNEAEIFAQGYTEDFPELPGQLHYYIKNHISAVRGGNMISVTGIRNSIRKRIRERAAEEDMPVPEWATEKHDE